MRKLLSLLFIVPFEAFGAAQDCATMKEIPKSKLSLSEVIELGLCRNPKTASSYLSYKSAQFAKNAGYSGYMPYIDASGSLSSIYRNEDLSRGTTAATISASYLIFDFGKRLSDVK